MSKSSSKKFKSTKSSKSNDNLNNVQETIQVEFVAHQFETHDFNGIEKLLNQLFLRCSVNLSDVADLIIKQNHIGSSIKIDNPISDDEDDNDEEMEEDRKLQQELEDSMIVYGLVSVLNISQHPLPECLSELKEFLLEKSNYNEDLSTLFNNKKCNVGLLISERFVNIPHDISLPCFKSLCSEMEKASKKGEKFNFDYYIIMCKVYKMKDDSENTIYVQAEDQYWAQKCELGMEYSVSDKKDQAISWENDSDSGMLPYRQIFVLTKEQFHESLTMLSNDLS